MGLFDGILNTITEPLFGRSATGEPAKMTSTTGPLTPEGQQLWDMVMGQLENTPPTRNIKFARNDWTFRTPNYNTLVAALMNMDASRRGTMQPFTPDQGGLLGGLAPILGAMAGNSNNNNNNNNGVLDWLLGGTRTGGGGYSSS